MKQFQINEDDLTELERLLPEVFDRMIDRMDNAMCVKHRQLQQILSNVRWNYGPPKNVEKIDGDNSGEEWKGADDGE